MGTWDCGNFDSDSALDFLGNFMDQLASAIQSYFDQGNADLDNCGESELMPTVAIMKTLSEHCGAAPPMSNVITDWQKRYLAIYDRQIDGLEPVDDYKNERRAVIDKTFNELIALSKEFWEQS